MNEIARWVIIAVIAVGILTIGYLFIINIGIVVPGWFLQVFYVVLGVIIVTLGIQAIVKIANRNPPS